MSCEGYQDKLVEALASGESALDGDVVGHLRVCAECKEFYEAQVHLFGAIDSGVRAMVNEAVPASLLPRVRAQVAEAGTPRRMWGVHLVPLGTALAVAILLSVFLMRPKNAPVRVAVVPAAESPALKEEESQPAREMNSTGDSARRALRGKPRIFRQAETARTNAPDETLQIVVGGGEAEGLVMLARNILRYPVLGQALLHPAAFTEGLTPAPQAIEIADLEVQPLSGQD